MKFPVDLLAHVSQEELERSAQNYMNTLLYSNPDSPESITLSDSTEAIINISTVGFIPLYGSSDKQKILALFTGPTDPFTPVALYLLNQWWTISDILKTEDNDRDGAVEVQTVGERIVLYSLNRVIYRAKEMSSEELPFLCHGETDYAKILWHNGEAVGFYSVKPSGSLCSSFSTRSYQLPVMDSIFVRKCHRGNGYGLQMLKDYVLSFTDSSLGLRYPLATAMYKVCQKYLSQYPGDADLLWEVQSIGGPNQRTNIAKKIQVMDLSVSKRLMYTEEPVVIMGEREKDTITTVIKEADSVTCSKCTVEILEGVTAVRAAEEADEVPVAAWDRNNVSKQWKIGENITEDKIEKVIRIEDIEAESPGEERVSEQQTTDEHNISEQEHNEDMLRVATEGKTEVEDREDSASMLDKATTVQASEDLQSESTVAPAAEECQDLCGLNALYDSQIAIENVVSEIEEAQKKDSTVVSREVLDICKEAEMVEMEWGTKNEACEEELAEIVIQQVKGQSTHATSAKKKAEKRGQAVVKTVHYEPPQLRSHTKTGEDEGRVLRRRTVVGSLASKCKSTQQSQKTGEKLETEFSSAKEVDELTGTEGEYGTDFMAVPEGDEIVTQINKTDQEQKNDEEAERSLIQDEAKESEEEKEPLLFKEEL
ncbi:soluble lamin-associated protein of 75 kDa-like isoform X2 [Sphaeramia orbicularis]|uniref:soluble lamin-associated protein of 75 kDa-like isoform X2 n=1 Tax=Sphaeramia orbicularis TaxID=375764 RepID=UPI00117D7DA2|nr:soluble lamin-associated protein of 75 kDa-like isoform X2 [Sphaeramia orbicularis]